MSDTENTGRYRTRVGHVVKDGDEVDVYVGRGENGRDMRDTPVGQRGWLGNPFTLTENGRGEAIERFRMDFEDRLDKDERFRDAVGELAGKTLGCWCRTIDAGYPECHGDIIADHAERIAGNLRTE